MVTHDPKEMTFLIVDDVDNMRRSIRAMLKLLNYGKSFYEAANGRDAWKLLQSDNLQVDFIISDYHMPHASGTELLNLLRSSRRTRHIPFLMITAEANMDIVAEAAEHDVDAYLTKPFVTATLEQKINELLERLRNPSPFTRHLTNARDLEEKGDLAGAIAEAKKAASLNAHSSRPFRELGRLFAKKGDIQKAQACFEQAIQRNRLDVTSYHALGQIAFRRNNSEKAIGYFSRAMEISPRHTDRALQFAKLLFKKNQLQEAEKVLKLVLRHKTNDTDFKEEVAEIALQAGLSNLALKAFREVIKADPQRTYLHKRIGTAMINAGEYAEGTRMLETALEKTPQDIQTMLRLARAYLEMKMPMRADNWASRALRIDPKNHEAQDIIKKCS
ncbi:tetratricopeptide repeat protein [Desulfurivibrio alkaliphilus]|uniref:Response regulator receiver protein n=1 Tax=Desulfurivibrio alkaliphilus (strain DSM 19089 / UNIQEM U267 / AHT2) TaxID=589865 RepID=D6Z3W6_DESAT|nr:tetratricopeptide repeat protein [Desulfurivibrio alkaliphilus]ADH86241.1 response regulator receiver protein [Desulfurivibrio alkaliphilus AHT 2]